jgi:chemotaxis protein histidine kinase CheA
VAAAEPDDEATSPRSTRTSKLWAEVRIDPVEIALPGGVGYTLRAYRSSTEIEPHEVVRTDEDLDDFDAAAAAVARRRRPVDHEDDEDEDAEEALEELEEESEEPDAEDFEEEEEAEEEEEEEDEEDEEDEAQEVPVFLGRNGKVYLFHSQEKLVEFVKSGAEHDLSQVDTWSTLVKKITKADVVPLEDDIYELDLVVENLRGGPDAWDAGLILKAGEIARDLGFALRLEPVLDDLDEALRSSEGGGVGSFFAKRKLKKIPAQQSSLAWRTIIGKISAAAEWQD